MGVSNHKSAGTRGADVLTYEEKFIVENWGEIEILLEAKKRFEQDGFSGFILTLEKALSKCPWASGVQFVTDENGVVFRRSAWWNEEKESGVYLEISNLSVEGINNPGYHGEKGPEGIFVGVFSFSCGRRTQQYKLLTQAIRVAAKEKDFEFEERSSNDGYDCAYRYLKDLRLKDILDEKRVIKTLVAACADAWNAFSPSIDKVLKVK